MGFDLPVLAGFAIISIAYAFGEGIGRLACLSFGCCYGKPLSETNQLLQTIFNNRSMVFTGKTKKIAYAYGLDGEKMLPIQAVTSVIYIISGLSGTYLFLQKHPLAALIVTIVTTQVWRIISEFFRADYRGDYRISLYQIMAVVSILYSVFISWLFPAPAMQPTDIVVGLRSLWNPAVIIFLQCVWGIIFFFNREKQSHRSFYLISRNKRPDLNTDGEAGPEHYILSFFVFYHFSFNHKNNVFTNVRRQISNPLYVSGDPQNVQPCLHDGTLSTHRPNDFPPVSSS